MFFLPPHVDGPSGGMGGEVEERVEASGGRVSTGCRPKSPWIETFEGSPGSAGKAGSWQRFGLWSTILWEEVEVRNEQRRGVTITWTTVGHPLDKQGHYPLQAVAPLCMLRVVAQGRGRLEMLLHLDRGRWVGLVGHVKKLFPSKPHLLNSESVRVQGPAQLWVRDPESNGPRGTRLRACCGTIL